MCLSLHQPLHNSTSEQIPDHQDIFCELLSEMWSCVSCLKVWYFFIILLVSLVVEEAQEVSRFIKLNKFVFQS